MFPIALTDEMSLYMLSGVIDKLLTGNIVAYAALTQPPANIGTLTYDDVASMLDSRYKTTSSPTWTPPTIYTAGPLRYAVTQSVNWFMRNNTGSVINPLGAYIVDESRAKLLAVQPSWPNGVIFGNSESPIYVTLHIKAAS